MMKFLPLLSAILLSASAFAADVQADTLTFTNVKKAVLTQSHKSMELVVIEQNDSMRSSFVWTPDGVDDSGSPLQQWNLNLPFLKQKSKSASASGSTFSLHGIYVGATLPCGNSPAFIKTGWEIGISQFFGAELPFRPGGTAIRLAAGFGWKILNVGSEFTLTGGQGPLVVEPLPAEASKAKAKITNFHFSVPLMLVQPLGGSGMVFSAGGELHLNTYSRASASFLTSRSATVKHKLRGLEQRFATIDVIAFLGMKNKCGLYARWSPMMQWRSGFGPDYKTVSIGAMLGF